ncbi:unnamed protein product [Caenorhabditis sp. 36 PRJEB53466]|nr:unnamed protein product [Caenorhabditis sp. 36 PRJEB53466]
MLHPFLYSIIFLSFSTVFSGSSWLKNLNLPRQLLEYHVATRPQLRERCLADSECKLELTTQKCFGFEDGCEKNSSLGFRSKFTSCDKNLNSKVEETFWKQADFGYLTPRMVKHQICSSEHENASTLSCSDQLTHCVGTNVFFDFSNLNHETSSRYRQDVIKSGQIGGKCEKFDGELLAKNLEWKGYLMSWSDELQHFQSNPDFQLNQKFCDFIFERPTIVMKLDAAVNLYHHFCDFLNLYASLHINQTFDQDVDIVWWDTHPEGFLDKMYGVTWKAFSKHRPFELKELDGKRVCFRNVMLPLLARQRNGLFYNTPLAQGCTGSSLFKSFSQFILHRLGIKPQKADLEKVRIVILSRSTAFRKFLNVKEVGFQIFYSCVINSISEM